MAERKTEADRVQGSNASKVPPNQQEIADALGVAQSTVARALRNKAGVSRQLRERILKKADEMGYKENPYVSAWMLQVRNRRPQKFRSNLVYVDYSRFEDSERVGTVGFEFYRGVRERAEKFGFNVETLKVGDDTLADTVLARQLVRMKNRGVEGIILSKAPHGLDALVKHPEFAAFAWAYLGVNDTRFGFHSTRSDQFQCGRIAFENVWKKGYRKIGFVGVRWLEIMIEFRFSHGFLAGRESLRMEERRKGTAVPMLIMNGDKESERLRFMTWLEKVKPEALVCTIAAPLKWLRQAGYRFPRDIGVATTDKFMMGESIAGVNQHHDMAGAAAIDVIINQLNRNERGLPQYQQNLLIRCDWEAGRTLRRVRK